MSPRAAQEPGAGEARESLQARAEELAAKNAPRIAAVLGVEAVSVPIHVVSPKRIKQMAGQTYGAVYTDGAIYLSSDGADVSDEVLEEVVIHEMAHATLSPSLATLPDNKNQQLFIEGLADYAVNTLTQSRGHATGDPRGGYQAGAAFLQYVEHDHPGAVRALVQSVASGDEAPFKQVTGQNYGQLLADYKEKGIGELKPTAELQKLGLADDEGNIRVPEGTDYSLLYRQAPMPPRLGPHFAGGIETPTETTTQTGMEGVAMSADEPTLAELILELLNQQNGNTGGDTGGNTGGSGGGGSTDPIEARRVAMYQSVYQSIWGEPATEAYLKSAANQGLNVWEFAFQERSKPAYFSSKGYNDKADYWVGVLKQLGVG